MRGGTVPTLRRRSTWIGIGAVVGVAAVVSVGLTLVRRPPALPHREVAAYLQAWERFDGAAMAKEVDRPADVAAAVTAMKDDLSVTKARFVAGKLVRVSGGSGDGIVRAPFTATLDLSGLGPWTYQGRLDLARVAGEWRIRWSPAALHPQLGPGQRFAVALTWPERAPILADDGSALVANGDVTVVGLQPNRIADQGAVEASLQKLLGVSPADVRAALAQPWVRPDYFVPIANVRPDQFATLRPQLEPIPGVFFQKGHSRLAPTDDFAKQVVGTVGEATAERLTQLGAPYVAGDQVGLSGIEAADERQLAGTPSGDVQIADASGRVVATLDHIDGTAPKPVRLTLDKTVQEAADQALAPVTQPAALVALDASTGEIRAVVSRPLTEEFDRALAGQYPPGSTFKIVTTAALLAGGLRPEDTVPCPAQANVGGKTFVNFETEALGSVPFTSDFVNSCNTAFVGLSTRLSATSLGQAATTFGFGASYDLGLPVAGGQFPPPADATELAAAAIGQARVLASPLEMASVAAAVANGSWRTPRLLGDAPAGDVKPLDASVAATLRTLMLGVVSGGTGTAAAEPGQAVAGKTGTAEFGTGNPPTTHAWFVGYRGTLAFAVLVEGGGVGGRVAAPIAKRFLDAVPA